jgi:hypothetical protein
VFRTVVAIHSIAVVREGEGRILLIPGGRKPRATWSALAPLRARWTLALAATPPRWSGLVTPWPYRYTPAAGHTGARTSSQRHQASTTTASGLKSVR